MGHSVVIIGAGMGGLTAAIRLRQRGFRVLVIEARAETGGLASGVETEEFAFDAGPYILLDRPGLEWVFNSLGLKLQDHVTLRRIEDVYEVLFTDGASVSFNSNLNQTADAFEQQWAGSGSLYTRFVASMTKAHRQLSPLLYVSKPGPKKIWQTRAWRYASFLLGSLSSSLTRTGLPQPVVEAIAIWTHIAGQNINEAPSPMAFVPALIHGPGAYYPVGGIASIPSALTKIATEVGVDFKYQTKVKKIVCSQGTATGVETDTGEFVAADAVISNHNGIGTYETLLLETPSQARRKLNQVPLQSPGVCAYLAVRGKMNPPYLKFYLPGDDNLCRLLVRPGVVAPELEKDGWFPARLIGPIRYEVAQRLTPQEQRNYLDTLLNESWWRSHVEDFRVLATRVPAEWGSEYHLYKESMNPVMTARFMRAGRLAHRSPYVRGLYLAGSSTHPGQWVSFSAISGVLAADDLLADIR